MNSRFAALAQTLSDAAARCPAGTEADRARLILTAASLAADGDADVLAAGKPLSGGLVQLIKQVDAILRNPVLANEIADAAGGLDDSFFQAVARELPDQCHRGRSATRP